MNKVILMGRTTADPDIRYTQDGSKVARVTLAVDRRGKDKEADFIRCVAFSGQADLLEKYVPKGRRIAIVGHIRTGSYTNQEGRKISTTDVILDELHFADSKPAATAEPAATDDPVANPNGGFEALPDDLEGLPFM